MFFGRWVEIYIGLGMNQYANVSRILKQNHIPFKTKILNTNTTREQFIAPEQQLYQIFVKKDQADLAQHLLQNS